MRENYLIDSLQLIHSGSALLTSYDLGFDIGISASNKFNIELLENKRLFVYRLNSWFDYEMNNTMDSL